jgi:beta-barrel assembly-enhancing protease
MKYLRLLVIAAVLATASSSCKKDGGGGINLFSLSQDKEFGKQTADEINANPAQYPLLAEDTPEHQRAYSYLRAMRDNILNTGRVQYKDDFEWELKIIKDDATLNAFVTPGGYIYVYTGLIKYLDRADDLAGVLGHEIGHADRRHTTQALTRQYGLEVLLAIVGGNAAQLGTIAANFASLSYSRENEAEADEYSVIYLNGSPYACNGAASFFQKLIDAGQGGGGPVFLSTHPAPASRVQDINAKAAEVGCRTSPSNDAGYAQLKTDVN